jgi:Ca2+-binding EF-hand superfamily protein
MKPLEVDDEELLKEFQRDILGFIEENKIDLSAEFGKLDPDESQVCDSVDFQNKLEELNINVQKDQMKLISSKYDPQKKGLVHYMRFCHDVY